MSKFERCVIATRESPLAMWQALHIQSVLRMPEVSDSTERRELPKAGQVTGVKS